MQGGCVLVAGHQTGRIARFGHLAIGIVTVLLGATVRRGLLQQPFQRIPDKMGGITCFIGDGDRLGAKGGITVTAHATATGGTLQ
ncbi:hypothetical protein D3C76_1403140 [compost metagenome]